MTTSSLKFKVMFLKKYPIRKYSTPCFPSEFLDVPKHASKVSLFFWSEKWVKKGQVTDKWLLAACSEWCTWPFGYKQIVALPFFGGNSKKQIQTWGSGRMNPYQICSPVPNKQSVTVSVAKLEPHGKPQWSFKFHWLIHSFFVVFFYSSKSFQVDFCLKTVSSTNQNCQEKNMQNKLSNKQPNCRVAQKIYWFTTWKTHLRGPPRPAGHAPSDHLKQSTAVGSIGDSNMELHSLKTNMGTKHNGLEKVNSL